MTTAENLYSEHEHRETPIRPALLMFTDAHLNDITFCIGTSRKERITITLNTDLAETLPAIWTSKAEEYSAIANLFFLLKFA